jgi:alanyl-tRNA synthetase
VKVGERELFERVQKLVERNRELERQLEQHQQQSLVSKGGDLVARAVLLKDGTKVLASVIEEASAKQLREVADDLRQRLGSSCIALGSVSEGKAIVLTAVSEDLVGRYNAGELMRQMSAVLGAKGGGKAQLAQAGGGDPAKLHQALERFQELVA